jgi:beta-glucosidase
MSRHSPLTTQKNVALLGIASYDFIAGGTGSGDVNEPYTITLVEGLINAGFEINEPAKQAYEKHKDNHEEAFIKPEGFATMYTPYNPPNVSYTDDELKTIAESADIGLITIGRNSGEGGDRVEKDDFLLTQDELNIIKNVSKTFHAQGKKVVVVLNVGGVIETASWKSIPDAILLAWQGGQESGNSVVDILNGKVNPSGKLPMTFPVNLNDHAANANFPLDSEPLEFKSFFSAELIVLFPVEKDRSEDEKVKNKDYTLYEEGIYVGYRHFDKSDIQVSYPFGYGLSYTDFAYSDLILNLENDTINIKVTIKNIGNNTGKEVVQVYTSKPDTEIHRPVKELKTFAKTRGLSPGDATNVTLQVPVNELRYWSEESAKWILEEGVYVIQVSASSRDIKFSESIEVNTSVKN